MNFIGTGTGAAIFEYGERDADIRLGTDGYD
jgi:hypothetical protein